MYIVSVAKQYSIAEARSNLPDIVDEAEAGAEIELTRRGKPVAVVVSLRQAERLRSERPQFGNTYKVFLKKHSLEAAGFDDDFFKTLRKEDPGRKVRL